MPSYIELRPPQWVGRPPTQVEMPREAVQDLAMMTSEGWLAAVVDAIEAERPEGYRRFLLALGQCQEQTAVVFRLAADKHCAAAEVIRYVSEPHKRRA